jgi:signal transduction histidine kinase
MTFRTRLLIGTVLVAILPLAGAAWLVRAQMRETVTRLDQGRIAEDAGRVERALTAAIEDLDRRAQRLLDQLPQESGVRMALSGLMDRSILVNWPGGVLAGTGLDVLTLLDVDGRILASAHAPSDTGQVADGWVALELGAPAVADLTVATGVMRVLAVRRSLMLEGRTIHVIAGRRLEPVLQALGRGPVAVSFSESPPPAGATVATMEVAVVRFGEWTRGAFVLAHDPAAVHTTLAQLDRVFLLVALGGFVLALVAAGILARGISAPIERLADRTARVDLERLDVSFAPDRTDELGQLERTLAALVSRLKASVITLRDAERRAAVGDMARQVNHDIKNGLVPIRNVLRHLLETAEQAPEQTAGVLTERRQTLEGSITYLEQLAANYARLTPPPTANSADLAGIVRAAGDAMRRDGVELVVEVDGALPVAGDPVAVRRIVENLVGNACDAARRTVTVTCRAGRNHVVLVIGDDGPGMTEQQLERAFAGFHSTKPGGTGLGLTVVRRLVQDLEGSLKVTTEPGRGTTVRVEFRSS